MDNLDNHQPQVPVNGQLNITAQLTRTEFKERLAKARIEAPALEKSGFNSFHKYNYVEAGYVQGIVGKLLAEHGILIRKQNQKVEYGLVKKDGKESNETYCRIEVEYGLADVYSDEVLWYPIAGEGRDTGDKAYYKALTGARKNFLIDALCLPIGDDPEASGDEEREDKKLGKSIKVVREQIQNKAKPSPEPTITGAQAEAISGLFNRHMQLTGNDELWNRAKAKWQIIDTLELKQKNYDAAFNFVKGKIAEAERARSNSDVRREPGED